MCTIFYLLQLVFWQWQAILSSTQSLPRDSLLPCTSCTMHCTVLYNSHQPLLTHILDLSLPGKCMNAESWCTNSNLNFWQTKPYHNGSLVITLHQRLKLKMKNTKTHKQQLLSNLSPKTPRPCPDQFLMGLLRLTLKLHCLGLVPQSSFFSQMEICFSPSDQMSSLV